MFLIKIDLLCSFKDFWIRIPPGGVGVFHAKGWWPKSSCPPSKVCLPWFSRRGIWDVPGILAGCPGPLGVFRKLVQKKFMRIFRSLVAGDFKSLRSELYSSRSEFAAKPIANWKLLCSFCHLNFVKEFPRFGRKISAKIGYSQLISANLGKSRLKSAKIS